MDCSSRFIKYISIWSLSIVSSSFILITFLLIRCSTIPHDSIYCKEIFLFPIRTIVSRVKISNDYFDPVEFDTKPVGLAKALFVSLFVYIILKLLDLAHYDKWHYLNTDYGYWYVFEVVGFVLVPAIVLINAIKTKNAKVVRFTSFWIAIGVILNRFNVSLIAYNWYIPFSEKYYPTWMEIALSLGVVTLIVLFYRFIVRRMAILS